MKVGQLQMGQLAPVSETTFADRTISVRLWRKQTLRALLFSCNIVLFVNDSQSGIAVR